MSDIVERLQHPPLRANKDGSYSVDPAPYEALALEAAAEIERLRGVLQDIAEHPGPNADDAAAWRADRAREAIRKQAGF